MTTGSAQWGPTPAQAVGKRWASLPTGMPMPLMPRVAEAENTLVSHDNHVDPASPAEDSSEDPLTGPLPR